MAKQVVLIDDITGDVIDKELGGGTLKFSVDGKNYSIDLGTKNTEAFHKAVQKYVEAAEEEIDAPRSGRRSSGSGTRAPSGSGRSSEELQAIRDWASKNGYTVSERGRIKKEIQDAFDEAHK